MWKIVPDKFNSMRGVSSVLNICAFPSGNHPDKSPIRKDMICVRVWLANGDTRWFGTECAKIGSDLRMHMIVNPRDEVLRAWKDSDDF